MLSSFEYCHLGGPYPESHPLVEVKRCPDPDVRVLILVPPVLLLLAPCPVLVTGIVHEVAESRRLIICKNALFRVCCIFAEGWEFLFTVPTIVSAVCAQVRMLKARSYWSIVQQLGLAIFVGVCWQVIAHIL